MILVVGSTKGGTGKSTTTANIGVQMNKLGYSVLLVDGNARQETLADWVKERNSDGDFPKIDFMPYQGHDLNHVLVEKENEYELILVDVGGQDSIEFRSALTVADTILSPCETDSQSLKGLRLNCEIVSEAKEINPELDCKLFFNKVSYHIGDRRLQDAKLFFQTLENNPFTLMKTHVTISKVFSDAYDVGAGVVESRHSKSAAQIQLLCQEIFEL